MGNRGENTAFKLDINPQFKKALDLMENTTKNVLVTGRAGTGKSTLLTYFRQITKKNVAFLAPTGVAALNIRGQTLHSFFRFKPDITVGKVKKIKMGSERRNLYQKLDAVVIDEISMVRADLLDCVARFLRLNGKSRRLPFGGLQMIFIGDLYQLSPVVKGEERAIFCTHYASPYFFDAASFKEISWELVELEKIYRQKDQDFIEILNAVRHNTLTERHLKSVNHHHQPSFEPDPQSFHIYLTTTNQLAEEINQRRLLELPGKIFTLQGIIEGDFDRKSLPTVVDLSVKEGAQIMMLNNDRDNRWVNGSLGKIERIIDNGQDEDNEVTVTLDNGTTTKVLPFTWELFRFSFDEKSKKLTSETIGSFTQYPFMLAWAVTIHKSQGKTFDRVIIDFGCGTFAPGQAYVALSRCTTLEGVVLKKKLEKKHILMDWRVVKFLTNFQYQAAAKSLSAEEKIKRLKGAVANKEKMTITYLKANDEKSHRTIAPTFVGEMEYNGKIYLGLRAFDSLRGEERTFRVDRILEMGEV